MDTLKEYPTPLNQRYEGSPYGIPRPYQGDLEVLSAGKCLFIFQVYHSLRYTEAQSKRLCYNKRMCLGSNQKRFVCRFFTCDHVRQMPDLQFNTAQVGRFLVAGRMLKRLLHPSVVADEEPIQRPFGETDAFARLLKVVRSDAVVVDERKHISVYDDLSEFLHEIRG